MKHVRFSACLALVALLTTGCLGGDDDKPTRVDANGTVTDPTAPAPLPPDAPVDPAAGGGTVPAPAPTPATNPPATTAPKPTATTARKPAPAPSGGEANVIQGVVRDEQGDPVPGAVITAAGYSARSNTVERATTDGAGRYRLPVPEGLYTVSGLAPLNFEGKTFKEMYLHPTDGNCGQQMSAGGITRTSCCGSPGSRSASSLLTGRTPAITTAGPSRSSTPRPRASRATPS